jgi:hypothetical protein
MGVENITAKFKKRSGSSRTRKHRVVCTRCNNEWMSRLESEVKPFLLSLLHGEVLTLAEDDQNTLANWITAKTIIAEFDDAPSAATTKEERTTFFETRSPLPNWRIWIGTYAGDGEGQWRNRYLHHGLDVASRTEYPYSGKRRKNTQITTFVGEKLLVHVFSSSFRAAIPHDLDAPSKALLRQVHPFEKSFDWPTAPPISNDDAERIGHWLLDLLPKMDVATIEPIFDPNARLD